MRKITALLLSLIMIFNIAVEATAASAISDISEVPETASSGESQLSDEVEMSEDKELNLDGNVFSSDRKSGNALDETDLYESMEINAGRQVVPGIYSGDSPTSAEIFASHADMEPVKESEFEDARVGRYPIRLYADGTVLVGREGENVTFGNNNVYTNFSSGCSFLHDYYDQYGPFHLVFAEGIIKTNEMFYWDYNEVALLFNEVTLPSSTIIFDAGDAANIQRVNMPDTMQKDFVFSLTNLSISGDYTFPQGTVEIQKGYPRGSYAEVGTVFLPKTVEKLPDSFLSQLSVNELILEDGARDVDISELLHMGTIRNLRLPTDCTYVTQFNEFESFDESIRTNQPIVTVWGDENSYAKEFCRMYCLNFNGRYLPVSISVKAVTVNSYFSEDTAIEDYNVNWYTAGTDELIGTGSVIENILPTANIEYEVIPSDDVLFKYKEAVRMPVSMFTLYKTRYVLTYKFEEQREAIAFRFEVENPELTNFEFVDQTATQTWGKKGTRTYENHTQILHTFGPDSYLVYPLYFYFTDSELKKDFETEITIKIDGYLPLRLHYQAGEIERLEDFSEGVKLIKVKFIPDNNYHKGALLLNIKESEPALPGEEPKIYAMDRRRIESVNVTINGLSTSCTDLPDYPYIIFDELSPGDSINVTMYYFSENSDEICSLSDTVTVGEDGTAVFDVTVPKKGYIQSTGIFGAENVSVYVFGGSSNPVYAENITTAFKTIPLQEGWYDVIFIEQNDIFNGLMSKYDLDYYGLIEGVDYVRISNGVNVEDGKITDVGEITVPHFDSSKFTIIDRENTSVTPGYTMITIGSTDNIRVEYAMSENYSHDSVNLKLDSYGGVEIDWDSVTFNGKTVDVSDHVIYDLPLSGIIRFQIRGYNTFNTGSGGVTITVSNERNGYDYLGGVKVDVANMTIRSVKKTARRTIPLSGRAISNAEVGIYDNDVLVGTAKTNALGDWKFNYELNPKLNYEMHEFYARLITNDGDWRNGLSSESIIVEYSDKFIDVSKVTVVGTDFVFDYNNPSRRNVGILLSDDEKKNTTYLIEFSKTPEKVRNVKLNVFNEDGTYIQTDAIYDAEKDCWVATAYSLPRNVGVEFDQDVEITLEDMYDENDFSYLDEAKELSDLLSQNYYLDDNIYVTDDESAVYFDIYLGDDPNERLGSVVITDGDYDQYDISDMESQHFAYDNDSQLWYRQSFSSEGYVLTFVDAENEAALDVFVAVDFSDVDTSGAFDTLSDFSERIMSYNVGGTDGWGRFAIDFVEQYVPGVRWSLAAFDASKFFADATRMHNILLDSLGTTPFMIKSKCKYTGALMLSMSDVDRFYDEYFALEKEADANFEALAKSHEVFKKRLINAILYDSVSLFIGGDKLLGVKGVFEKFKDSEKVIKVFGKSVGTWGKAATIADGAFEGFEVYSQLKDAPGVFFPEAELPTEVGNIFDFTDLALGPYWEWLNKEYLGPNGIVARASDLNSRIANALVASPCREPEIKNPNPFKPPEQSPCNDGIYIRDPSGFVCEAVASNRLEGVKAEAYYDPEGNSESLWGAEEYGQQNPMYTDSYGRYAWFVPNGNWRVKFEKEGYETEWSDWVTVPPIQTEVNVALVSTANPAVKYVTAYNDSVRIEFTQYMDVSTVNGNTVTVMQDGQTVSGMLKPLNAENGFDNPEIVYASEYEFVPNTDISGSVTISVNGAYSYNGKPIVNYSSGNVEVMVRAEKIIVTPSKNVVYGEDDFIDVSLMPENAYGYTLTVKSQTPEIANVGDYTYKFTSAGETIRIPVSGILPGETVIEYDLEGTGVTATTVLNVVFRDEKSEECATVVAEPDSGSYPAETKITLSTATPGASIYYTLDKTCPCLTDSPSRILYTGPITLTEEMYIIAYAVKDGFEDSATKGYHYTISEYDCNNGAHKWNDGVVTSEPSCTKNGEKLYTCELCGETKTETIAAIGHNSDTAYHSDSVRHWHICLNENCDAKDNIIDVESHKESTGYKHDENEHWHFCAVCGYELEKTAHSTSTPLKCDQTGHWSVCDSCGEKYGFEKHINAILIPEKKPTASENGNVAYWYCPDCGKYFYDIEGEIGAGPYDSADQFITKLNVGCNGNHLLVCVPVNDMYHMLICQHQCGFVMTLPHNFGLNGICLDCGYTLAMHVDKDDNVIVVDVPTEGKINCEDIEIVSYIPGSYLKQSKPPVKRAVCTSPKKDLYRRVTENCPPTALFVKPPVNEFLNAALHF